MKTACQERSTYGKASGLGPSPQITLIEGTARPCKKGCTVSFWSGKYYIHSPMNGAMQGCRGHIDHLCHIHLPVILLAWDTEYMRYPAKAL